MIEPILVPLLTAAAMSLGQYAAKMKAGDDFKLAKFGRTMLAGIAVGITAYFTGNEPTFSNPESVGLVAAGTGLLDVASKYVIKLISKKGE